jgi:hypothetical protein
MFASVAPAAESQAQPVSRSVAIYGISLGSGALTRGGIPDSRDNALAILQENGATLIATELRLHAGRMITDSLALTGGLSVTLGFLEPTAPFLVGVGDRLAFGTAKDPTVSAVVWRGEIQYWIRPRVWVAGGLGLASLEGDFEDSEQNLSVTLRKTGSLTLLASAGIEVWQRRTFAMDVEFRYFRFRVDGVHVQSPTFNLGFNWY